MLQPVTIFPGGRREVRSFHYFSLKNKNKTKQKTQQNNKTYNFHDTIAYSLWERKISFDLSSNSGSERSFVFSGFSYNNRNY